VIQSQKCINKTKQNKTGINSKMSICSREQKFKDPTRTVQRSLVQGWT